MIISNSDDLRKVTDGHFKFEVSSETEFQLSIGDTHVETWTSLGEFKFSLNIGDGT